MWQRRVPAAVLAGFLPAGIGSAIVSRRDLSGLRRTRPGHYVLTHIPPSAQAVRFAGQVVAWRAAYRHRPWGIAAGHFLIMAGWSFGFARPPVIGPAKSKSPYGLLGSRGVLLLGR